MHVNKSKFIFYYIGYIRSVLILLNLSAESCEVNTDSKIYDLAIELIEIYIENTYDRRENMDYAKVQNQ